MEVQMKRAVIALMTAVTMLVAGLGVSAQEVQTVTGEVVDINAYLRRGKEAIGPDHKDMAVANARRGEPLGILATDGLYIIKGEWTKNKNEKLIEFVGEKVTARGEVRESLGKKLLTLTEIAITK
jgi:hypothetical protein